jgi:hypothetical protein
MGERHCNADDEDKYDYDDGSDDYAFTMFLASVSTAVHINLLENSGTLPLACYYAGTREFVPRAVEARENFSAARALNHLDTPERKMEAGKNPWKVGKDLPLKRLISFPGQFLF